MGLNTEERQNVVYFTGYEVEHTPAYNMFTLFVVGTPPLEEILMHAKQMQVEQIYFGTSQSFKPAAGTNEIDAWEQVMKGCLEAGYWVALDYDVGYHLTILETSLCEYNRFIPMISVKLPYVKQLNYNATIKIDDTTWGASNPGVWCHKLHDLMRSKVFTNWDAYVKDSEI